MIETFKKVERSFRSQKSVAIQIIEAEESLQRGLSRGVSETEADFLAFAFHALRVDMRITLDELSKMSGVSRADIVDVELGNHFLADAVQITGKLRPFLGIDQENYNRIVLSSVQKK